MGIRAGTRHLSGGRHNDFIQPIRFVGLDLTGAAMNAQVRLTPDAPGAVLIDLDIVGTGATQGIQLSSVVTEDGVKVSTIILFISKATMQGMPAASELGDDAVFYWDLLLTPTVLANPTLDYYGGVEQRYLKGKFVVEGAVTS